MVAATVLLPQTAAHAAAVTHTENGITFSADDANIPAGATVTGYTPGSLDVVIPSTITISGNTYDVTKIESGAFQSTGITSVAIPTTVTEIGGNAFRDNALTTVAIPNSVTTIGNNAFQSNGLTSVTLPNGLTNIAEWVFSDNALTSIVLPNTLTTIGTGAFNANALTSVTIPASVTLIDEGAFAYNPGLVSAYFMPTTPPTLQMSPGGMCVFEGSAAAFQLFYPAGSSGYTPAWNVCGYNLVAANFTHVTGGILNTVTFDTAGGSAVSAEVVDTGDSVTKPADPVRAGYQFAGWVRSGASGQYDFGTLVNMDITLVAQWRQVFGGGQAGGGQAASPKVSTTRVGALANTGESDQRGLLFGAFALTILGGAALGATRFSVARKSQR